MVTVFVRSAVDLLVYREIVADLAGCPTKVVFHQFEVLVGRHCTGKHPSRYIFHPMAKFDSLAVSVAREARRDLVGDCVVVMPAVG